MVVMEDLKYSVLSKVMVKFGTAMFSQVKAPHGGAPSCKVLVVHG